MILLLIIALLFIIILTVIVGLLALAQKTPAIKPAIDIDTIENLLPQTQCGDCGFTGCRPYATAIINRKADINRCLPGGKETVRTLSSKLGMVIKPLYKETRKYQKNRLAVITEEHCIGCVKCVAACPVDAILGAPKQMHSIINAYCTGCELCIAPCPVDCISMIVTE